MKILLALLLPVLAFAQDAPKIFFSKTFPGSRPAYMEVRLDRDGRAEYREGPDEDNPVVLKLAKEDVDTIFALADKLEHFNKELESGLKVARMGDKLLRWQHGAEKHEAKFNYSADPDAQAIHDWFERINESALYFIDLERAAKYDKLGVNSALLKLEAAWDRHRLVALPLFLPLLDRVDKNENYLNMARERAARLAALFRNPPPAAPAKP
ncbi:MAG: hypothetical protein IPP47_24900 [Bryobacterales bacterium]|nr:hypothetical protein [Bryobacterales bacterium]